MARRALVALSLLAFATSALAGCLGPSGGEPLRPSGTVGGAAVVPDVAAEGAEVLRYPDAVELVWRGEAGFAPPPTGLPVGLPVPMPAPVAQAFRQDRPFPMPVEVTVVEATLTWANEAVNLNLFVRDAQGFTQCRSTFGVEGEPAKEACRVYKVGARPEVEEWVARVQVAGHPEGLAAPEPFELRVNLSVRPFPLLGPALAPEERSPRLSFFTARVDEERRTGEPSLKVDGQGNVYIAAPTGRMQSLWRTSDGGATFEWLDIEGTGGATGALWGAAGSGGGDSEVFVTDDGSELYFSDLYGTCFSVASSADAGASWRLNPASCDVPYGNDRQWLWAQPGGHLWMNYNGFMPGVGGDAVPRARGLTLLHSIDGGLTWPFRLTVPEDRCARGNIAVDAEGRVYMAGCNDAGPGVAVVEPASFSHTWHTVADRSGEPLGGFCYVCGIFTVVDLDTAGNPYVVWADPSEDGLGHDVWMSTSQDRGQSWSEPVKVNRGGGSAVLPWVAAGEPGHVAVAWYQTRGTGDPNAQQAEWYVHMAESLTGLDAAPVFDEALVQERPVQFGPLCTVGSRCGAQRNLLDFLMLDVARDGVVHVAYNDGSPGGSPGNTFVMYARTVTGLAADAYARGAV